MNDFLSSIIDAALIYATPLPIAPEDGGDENNAFYHSYQGNESQNRESDIQQPYDVEPGCINTSSALGSFVEVQLSEAGEINGRCRVPDLAEEARVFQCDTDSNALVETTSCETSNCSSDFVTLTARHLTNTDDADSGNPLKALLKTPTQEKETKRKRGRVKRNANDKSLEKESTERTDQKKYGFDISMTVSEDTNTFDDSLDSFPSVSPQHHVDVSTCPTPVSETGGTVTEPVVKKKRTRRREVNPGQTPPPQILPPCRVCDDKSSGFHYGANTCEACKGFFRRTLKKKEVTFQCKCTVQEKEAWQRGPYKNGCPACRYERCLAIGMSKNAIKIGRYTLDRKTENIKEVKSLEAMDSVIQAAITEATTSSGSPDSQEASHFLEGLRISSQDDMSTINMDTLSVLSESHESSEPVTKKARSDKSDDDSNSSADVFRKGGLTLKEIDTTVKILVDAFNTHKVIEPRNINPEVIRQRQSKCLERYNLKTALFGKMTSPSMDVFREFYQATGIELDDRAKDIQKAFDFFESRISVIVAYAKCIPGFKDLHVDDQASLIKASRLESVLIGGFSHVLTGVDIDKEVVVTPWGVEYHMDEIEKILPRDFIHQRYEMASQMKKLDLTIQELTLMRAIAITSPDRCQLHSREKVEAIQIKLVACLEHQLSVRPGGTGNKLYKIMDTLTRLRDLSERDAFLVKKMFLDWPDLYANYYLLSEFVR